MYISPINNTNQYYSPKKNSVSFCAVDIKKPLTKITNSYSNSFKNELNNIVKKYNDIKTGIKKSLHSHKLKRVQEDELLAINTFYRSQEAFLKAQDDALEQARKNLELMKLNNEQQDKIIDLESTIIRQQKIREKTEMIAKNKSQKQGFDSIAGYADEKNILITEFINKLPLEMAGENVYIPNSILFYGPNGNGKTTFAKAFANSAACHFEKVKGIGKTAEERQQSFLKNLFDKAEKAQENFKQTNIRTILLVDEFDGYANQSSTILPELKGFMETCSEDYHCTLFNTTNNPLSIVSAIRDAKRTPIKVSIDPPDKNNIKAVFKHYLKDVDCEEINFDELAEMMLKESRNKSYNNSQIELMCNNCIEEIDGKISQNDLIHQIKITEPAITQKDLEKFEMEKSELTNIN